jgi:hypothetical protein
MAIIKRRTSCGAEIAVFTWSHILCGPIYSHVLVYM